MCVLPVHFNAQFLHLELQVHNMYFPNITLSQSLSALGPIPKCGFAVKSLKT